MWLRDYVYANGDRVGAVANTTLHPPFLWAVKGRVLAPPTGPPTTEVCLSVSQPEFNVCRSHGVRVFRREEGGSYDWNAPLTEEPFTTSCPVRDGLVDDPVGDACYVVRAEHVNGELGPASDEICVSDMAMDPACGIPAPPPGTGCPAETAVEPTRLVKYHFTDHLGTPRLTVSEDGFELERLRLTPYGEELDVGSCAQPPRFTGHERDVETGLDYMMARYYGSVLARFMTIDTVDPIRSAPLTWNRYTYGGNNPMRNVDPTGRLFISFDGIELLQAAEEFDNAPALSR